MGTIKQIVNRAKEGDGDKLQNISSIPATMTELLEQVHLPSAETGVNNIILPDTIGKGTVEKI